MFGVITMVTVAVSATVRTCEEDIGMARPYILTAFQNFFAVVRNHDL